MRGRSSLAALTLRRKQGRIISEMFDRAAQRSADMARERVRSYCATGLRPLFVFVLDVPSHLETGDGRRAI
jgi:hypothetical protein